jgi:O-antigen/teichoic acid export membrane protein
MFSKIKKFGSETIIYGMATVLGRFLNFLLTPMYSNLLQGKEYEFIIYIYALLAFVNVIYSFGMESAFFRFFSKENSGESKKVFTHSFYMINIISLVFTLIIIFNSNFLAESLAGPDVLNASYLIQIVALIPFLDALILIPMGYLRMTNQAKKFAAIRFVMIAFAVFLNFLFLKVFEMQSEGVIYSQLIASFLGVVYLLPIIIKNFLLKLDVIILIKMLKFGLPTLPANLAAIILQVADRPILKALAQSSEEIVTYQVNYRLGIPMMIFVTVFEYAWKPFYLSNYSESNAKEIFSRIFTYFTLVAALIFLLVSMFISLILKMPGIGGKYFINPEYWHGLYIVPIILAAYFFNGIFTNISSGFLIMKETKYLPFIVGFSAIVNVVANFILIPILGFAGAAWATLIAYFISAVVIYHFSRKIYYIQYEWKRIFIIVISTLIIFVLDKYLSTIFTDYIGFGIKIILLVLFLVSLKTFKFFSIDEIKLLKKLFRRN